MRNTDELILNGIQSANTLGGLLLLQSYVSIEDLFACLPQEHLLLEQFSENYGRSVNKERLTKLESYYLKNLVDNTPFNPPKVSIAVFGKAHEEQLYDRLINLQYEKSSSAVVEGFLVISALSNLLGRIDPFTGKKIDTNILSAKQKQTLLSIDIQLGIYYGHDKKINEQLISKLFFDINTVDTRVYSQYITMHGQESPLKLGVDKLSLALELDVIGGVSELNKLTKSDSFVTTKSTLIHILLASLGGKGIRVEKRLPTHLPNKVLITDQLIDDALESVIPLMLGWLSCLESKFKQDINGFHRSMQVWQALGVVVHHLTSHSDFTRSELFLAGQVLGQLNYDKSASHWERCKAFKKDASDSFWINATGGGRTFRDKVADYFIELL